MKPVITPPHVAETTSNNLIKSIGMRGQLRHRSSGTIEVHSEVDKPTTQPTYPDDYIKPILIKAGDSRVKLGIYSEPPQVDCYVLAAENLHLLERKVTDLQFSLDKEVARVMELQKKYDEQRVKNAELQTQLNAAWSKSAFVGEGSFDGCGD